MEQENLPQHIAIIMDGNRRWAKKRGLPVGLGHKEGAKTLEKIVRYANKRGIKYRPCTPLMELATPTSVNAI